MHHTQKKKFVGMKEAGATQEEIRDEMVSAEIAADEIDAFLQELFGGGEPPAPEEQKGEAKKPVAKLAKSNHPIYEEWKMAINSERGEQVLEKVKKVNDVKIDHARAERLNEQAMNRRVKYFLKEN